LPSVAFDGGGGGFILDLHSFSLRFCTGSLPLTHVYLQHKTLQKINGGSA
jgi:hypothetical protein